MKSLLSVLFCLCMALGAAPTAAKAEANCDKPAKPVVSLKFGSRYKDGDPSRSDVDKVSNAQVNKALAPVEKFIRTLAKSANKAVAMGGDVDYADCVVISLAHWAKADALSEMKSFTANLSVGSRLAAFGMVYSQVRGYSQREDDKALIEAWLLRRAKEQMLFWEEDATYGSKRGNLRAWATLGVNLAAMLAEDEVALRWSAWSATFLQCQALADGSLPQEMKRGKYALHYQLHAIAPMVTTTLLLETQGHSINGVCDNALRRIVNFALSDLATGEKSQAYSGKVQSYFDGTEELRAFELAWIEAYLKLYDDPAVDKFAEGLRPFSHSKLGGNQELVWSNGFF